MNSEVFVEWLCKTKDEVLRISFEYEIEIATSLVVLVTLTRGKKCWLNLLHLFIFAEAMFLVLFGNLYLHYTTVGEIDELHLTLFKGYGVMAIFWCFCYFLLSKTTDATCKSSQLMGLLIFLSCITLAQGYLFAHPAKPSSSCKMNEKVLTKLFFVSSLLTIGTLYQTLRLKNWGGFNEIFSHVNFHLRLDFVLLMVMGVLMYSLPQWTLRMMAAVEKVDTVHALYARSIGAGFIAMAYMSARSANFLKSPEKDAVMISHWLYYVLICIISWYGLLFKWSELSWKQVTLQTVHDFVRIINATGALGCDCCAFKLVIMPRFQSVKQDIKNYFKTKKMHE